MQLAPSTSTKLRSSNALGSTGGGEDVGEDLERRCAADVVAVAGRAVGDHAAIIDRANLLGLEGFDHAAPGHVPESSGRI